MKTKRTELFTGCARCTVAVSLTQQANFTVSPDARACPAKSCPRADVQCLEV